MGTYLNLAAYSLKFRRKLKQIWASTCIDQKFKRCPPLPTTSVVIVFHNEAWSTLLRTVYSVLHSSPARLLREVILVDDASTDGRFSGGPGSHLAISSSWLGCICQEIPGSSGHACPLSLPSETTWSWLSRIAEEPTAVVSPDIATIDLNTFEFSKPVQNGKQHSRGNFDWSLTFGWEVVPPRERQRRKDETFPIKSPTFAGGLFAISRSYFEHIGSYDDQMEIWGGENVEMSFRVRPGVTFKGTSRELPVGGPGGWTPPPQVWLPPRKTFGDITERRRLRERLHCRNFTWYLQNVYPEMFVPDLTPTFYGAVSAGMAKASTGLGPGWEQRSGELPKGWVWGICIKPAQGTGVGAATFVTRRCVCHRVCHCSLCLSVTTSVTGWPGRSGLRLSWNLAELVWGELQGGEPTGTWIWVKLGGRAENFPEPRTVPWHREGRCDRSRHDQNRLIKNLASGMCLTARGKHPALVPCDLTDPHQLWSFT
ncbi:PREDICTED: polypeptide N-acetylgalactosaminyltransferase 6-like [Corvus brachyrhynchos]|uniref:polypeptide N-acetylgalactosaminyltransferase 6-like n=1 Tax=Corvus brachyrhynchos TaxID=85066 RepID=UPI00081669C1|nr:PREDICTED: polypeptide N-acetylgalactosaminyltransferase 6-like [Corvus brachyrhynchos]